MRAPLHRRKLGWVLVLAALLAQTGRCVETAGLSLSGRPLTRTTPLSPLEIVVPDQPEWKELGGRLAEGLGKRAEREVRVRPPDPERFQRGWADNAVEIGSLGNNIEMARLYGLRLSYADGIYPGAGGYQLLSVLDPFGLGGNTIVIGTNDLGGANRAVDRLLALVPEGGAPEIPWVAEVSLSPRVAAYFPFGGRLSPEEAVGALARAEESLAKLRLTTAKADPAGLDSLLGQIGIAGEYYQLTASPAIGAVYRALLLGYSRYILSHSEAAEERLHSHYMWTTGEELVENWSVMEASPLFTEEDRRQIVRGLFLTYSINASDHYLQDTKENGPRWNHQAYPALSLLAGGIYFRSHYRLPEGDRWFEQGGRIFSGNTAGISLDDGPDYMMHIPKLSLDYAIMTGNRAYDLRSLRANADLNILMIDNLGMMSGGGDAYPFGVSNAFAWGHSQVMNAAYWYYRDPIYPFMLEAVRRGPFRDQVAGPNVRPGRSSIEKRPPEAAYPLHRYAAVDPEVAAALFHGGGSGVRAAALDAGVYDFMARRGGKNIKPTLPIPPGPIKPLDVGRDEAFHKLAFRSGFAVDDSYLAIDGFSTGTHGHEDGNTIIGFSAKGRVFLADRDYIEGTPEHKNGLVVIRDGRQAKKPPLVRLEWVGDIGGVAVSRTTVPNDNGLDWSRTIVSPSGDFHLIFDQARFREEGDFLLQNIWQTLGTPSLGEGNFVAEQKGVAMKIQDLDSAELQTHERYGHFLKYWKLMDPYPYADHETVLTEVKAETRHGAGESSEFVNVLSTTRTGAAPVEAHRLDARSLLIEQGSRRWLAREGPWQSGQVRSDGAFHLWGEGRFLAAAATRLEIGSQVLKFPQPVFFTLDTSSGEWESFGLRRDFLHYDRSGNAIQEGPLGSGRLEWAGGGAGALEAALAGGPAAAMDEDRGPARLRSLDPPSPRLWRASASHEAPHFGSAEDAIRNWKKLGRFSGDATDATLGRLAGVGDDLVAGGTSGRVEAIDAQGRELWTFQVGGRVNEVTVQLLGSRPVVFVATENWFVHALDAGGRELWRHEFPHDSFHREMKGNLLGITRVRVARVRGRPEAWVIVGTQFDYVYGLDPRGREAWQIRLSAYGIEDMAFADAGDGGDEGIIGLEYTQYAYWNGGHPKMLGGEFGPGWKVVRALGKIAGEPGRTFALGTKQDEVHLVRVRDGAPRELWNVNVGGEVNDIECGDFGPGGAAEIIAGSDGFQCYVLNADGGVRFRRTLGGRVLKVGGWKRDGGTTYLAAAEEGRLYELSARGEIEQEVRFPAEIAALPAGADHRLPRVVLKNGEVYVRLSSLPGAREDPAEIGGH